jgi:tRNA A-37 threonylcarbamoyl transferase component Bud32
VTGTLVGRYELEVPLGRGAMGEVWRGRDLATRQPVAVKLVQLANIDDQVLVGETIARFRREADTLARLRHPNIISALEAGRVGSELFMVMELAEGMSMAAMLRQRQANGLGMFPVESVLRIAKQACSGLAAAHAIGVVHRDIKPSNLMVSARGHLTIVDFGIARLLEDNSPRLTAQDETVGTLLYMSPEQAAGIDVDGRSDLYSFGCVLYELLAGRPPFVAEIPITLMRMHLQERPVPMRNIRADLPNGLPELVDQLLEKERGARPPDAEYVVRSLVGISDNFNGGATPEHEADRRTFVVGGADQRGADQRGADQRGADQRGADQRGADQRGGDQRGGDQRGGAEPWPPAAPGPEAYRPTVLAGDARFPQQDTYRQMPNPADQGAPGQSPWQPAPAAPGSGSGSGRRGKHKDSGKRRANGGPDGWPTARPRPRRRRWTGVLSSLLTFAIVAGIAAYVWNKTHHQALTITAATVSVANPGKIACNSTVDVVGTIFTNGNGGPITYQWTKDGENLPTGTVTATSGQQQVRVDLKWNLRGQGTHHAAAIFQVFTPNVISAQSASFTYECAS